MKLLGALLLVPGALLVGFRIFERLTNGFIGQAHIAGFTFAPVEMPLLPISLVLMGTGTVILWVRAKRAGWMSRWRTRTDRT